MPLRGVDLLMRIIGNDLEVESQVHQLQHDSHKRRVERDDDEEEKDPYVEKTIAEFKRIMRSVHGSFFYC